MDHEIELKNPRLAKVVARVRDLPGQELFQYLDEEGERHSVDSNDVNEYLQEHQRPAVHGQGFPHLGRNRARGDGAAGI